MPFLFSDRETVARLLDGEIGEELRQSMRESAGLEVLAFGELGFRHITNNVRPIVKPEDLKGIKIRVPGSEPRILAFRPSAPQPITMNFGELYLALQQGTVDGQENPLAASRAGRSSRCTSTCRCRHVYSPVTLVMNGAKYDSLTPEQQAAVKAAAQEAANTPASSAPTPTPRFLAELEQSMEVNEIDREAFAAAASSRSGRRSASHRRPGADRPGHRRVIASRSRRTGAPFGPVRPLSFSGSRNHRWRRVMRRPTANEENLAGPARRGRRSRWTELRSTMRMHPRSIVGQSAVAELIGVVVLATIVLSSSSRPMAA
jgi:hypothetical protein